MSISKQLLVGSDAKLWHGAVFNERYHFQRRLDEDEYANSCGRKNRP